jgi:hypothetical protein
VDRIAAFDAFRFTDMIAPRPLPLIVGTAAVTSWTAREVFIAAREPKHWHWIEGAMHNDLYDKDEHVTPAVARLAPFFRDSLTSALAA